jgi:4-amino-4-deoxy-L-arabinose transferase-like glycosyltransferase
VIASLPFNFPWLLLVANGMATALSVPLLYSLGKETFRLRLPALLSAIIYLTFLPIFIYGRTASLNGFILLLEILLFTCGLRSRRDLRWSLGVGLSAGILILFNHWLGFLFIITLFTFLCWDTPRLITSGYFWLGSILGSVFPLAYYGYTVMKTETLPSLLEVYPSLSHFSPLACLKLVLFALPWLIFLKDGWKLAWKEPQWSWAKFVIIWGGITSLGAVFTAFFAPFPVWLSIYPVLALIGGMAMSYVYQWPSDRTYPLGWSWFLFSLAVMTFIGGFSLYLNLFDFFPDLSQFADNQNILLLMSALILTFVVSGILILRRNQQFIAILAWGLYISSIIWFNYLHSLVFSV